MGGFLIAKDQIIALFIHQTEDPEDTDYTIKPNIEDVKAFASSIIWITIIGQFPGLWKLVLQGAIMALEIQHKVVWHILFAFGPFNYTLTTLLIFHFKSGFLSLYYSLITTESYLALIMAFIIYKSDW